ncbi:MAG: hypothetical protein ABT940_03075 [Alphaproteobacteria bacterium]
MEALRAHLGRGKASLEDIAKRAGISSRRLRSMTAEDGTVEPKASDLIRLSRVLPGFGQRVMAQAGMIAVPAEAAEESPRKRLTKALFFVTAVAHWIAKIFHLGTLSPSERAAMAADCGGAAVSVGALAVDAAAQSTGRQP